MQQLSKENLYKVIVNCLKQDLIKTRNLVQNHDYDQQAKKRKAALN